MTAERPAIRRQIEPVSIPPPPELEVEGPLYLLRDPFRLSAGPPCVVPAAGLAVVSLLDGTRTVAQVVDAFLQRHGVAPPRDQVEGLVAQLDAARLLEGPHLTELVDAFARAEVRSAACIGSYPGEPEALRAFLNAQYVREGGPGGAPRPANGAAPIHGIISPHIDPQRGGATYAWSWRAVAEACPASLFVVFGTSHAGTAPVQGPAAGAPPRYALTRKAFETPLGLVPTDVALVDRLVAAYDGPDDLFAGEFHHKGEHSVEFQAVYLAHLFNERRPVRILPILCGGLHEVERPSDDPAFVAFHRALTRALAPLPPEDVAFVAAIDLDHVGAQFHQPPVDAAALRGVERADRRTLSLATASLDPDAVHADIQRAGGGRSICGHSALVGFLQAMRSQESPIAGELLHYGCWHDGESAVSFASAVYRQVQA